MKTILKQPRSAFTSAVANRASRPARTSVVRSVAEADSSSKERKMSPLQRGGTLSGAQAAGKDAGEKAKATIIGRNDGIFNTVVDGTFVDDRWYQGRWDLDMFPKTKDGETDWDKVIDAEIARRSLLENKPIPSRNEYPVLFDTAEIPWWAWVRRFHLPEAEKLNGRAAMMGYLLAGIVDLLSGAGLIEQQESFLGKLSLHLCVFFILLIRSTEDLEKYKGMFDEATFYDKQWSSTWDGSERPSERQEK